MKVIAFTLAFLSACGVFGADQMSLPVPPAYEAWLKRQVVKEVSYGSGGIELEPLKQIHSAQQGYSVGPGGKSLIGDEAGSWKSSWLVVGRETTLGDPLFIDTSEVPMRVYTAPHGMGSWEAEPIAASLEGFSSALSYLKKISIGREHPVGLEEHPLSASERRAFLKAVKAANPRVDLSFWEILVSEPE